MMRAILFDCDGTIADTCGLICEAMRRVFVQHELAEPGDAATRAIIGLSLDEAILRLHPECEPPVLAGMVEAYRLSFRRARAEGTFREALFPGMKALIEELRGRDDVLLGLVTGKSRRGVRTICEAHDLEGCFQAVRTADDCLSKPHPAMVLECCEELGVEPHRALVVGDAVFDMQMAKAAGAEALGVAWGASEPGVLVAAGAAAVADSAEELRILLLRWLDGGSLASSRVAAGLCERRAAG